MEAEHNGIASQSGIGTRGQRQETSWYDRKARVVGITWCRVARRMAQWAALKDDERQQGAGATNTPVWQSGSSSNDEVPHPLMDCGHGKFSNKDNKDPAPGQGSAEGSGDVEIGQNGGRVGGASDGDEDAMGNTVYDVPIAIAGVNCPITGAPHPINKSVRLRKCESIPPPHSATPPSGGQMMVNWKSVPQPPPNGATPPSGGQQSV
jgi:hypothetical protein